MNVDTYALQVSFDIDECLERQLINRIIGEVMASVGFFGSHQLQAESAEQWEDWRNTLLSQDLPAALFGSHFTQTKHWVETHNMNPSSEGVWNASEGFVLHYTSTVEAFGVFKGVTVEERTLENGFYLNSLHFWDFLRGRDADDPRFNKLIFYSGINSNVLKLPGMEPVGCRGLDRYWVLAFQDAVMQIHRRLRSRETVIWEVHDDPVGPKLVTLEYPSKMYFWDFDLYQGVPLGVPKIDAALDAYENDLRTDRLREKVIGMFETNYKPNQ